MQEAGRHHKADPIGQRICRLRQLTPMGIAVKDREDADDERGDPEWRTRAQPIRTPSAMPDSATICSVSGRSAPATPRRTPSAITSGKVIGSTQIAGLPSWAPQRPTATMATRWSSPVIGCMKPDSRPIAAALPECAKADCPSAR